MLEVIKYNTPVVNYLISSQYIENKINKVSEKNTNIDDSGGEISYADKEYIHNFSLEWPELKNQICSQLNFNWKHPELIRKDHGETILNTIVSANYDPHMIEMYLSEREGLFKHRQDNEYSIIRQNPCKLFPYNYLTDYACKTAKKLIDYKSAKISHTSISFIYCVKNRSERLRLSLETLISSLREASIKYEILIIEDKSENLFNGLPHAQRYKYVKHFVVDTKIAWTRSGLLNVGIKNASHEWVAFLDVDFLFGREFGSVLERTLAFCDPNKLALVVNSIETETHLKENFAYSAGSPYGYMWMCGRAQAINVNGFDEGFQGHGFEDRDFQDKLLKIANLSIIDSLSFDDYFYVFHLSHFVRSGSDNRAKNRERYKKRSESVAELLKNSSSDWGNYEILAIHNYLCEPEDDRLIEQPSVYTQHRGIALPENTGVTCDYLFIPHNHYHGDNLCRVASELKSRGLSVRVLKMSPPHPDEGAFIERFADYYIDLSVILNKELLPHGIVVMNDWESNVAAKLIEWANTKGIGTYAIVEGVNDYHDVDTGRSKNNPRRPYQRVKNLFLNGDFDRKYFSNSNQRIATVGIDRLDTLADLVRTKGSKITRLRRAVINCNFTYGVLVEHAQNWIAEVIDACESSGINSIVSKHQVDKTVVDPAKLTSRRLYDELLESEIFITRFSGAVFEALIAGCKVIYYNPGIEKIDKFNDPMGAYLYAHSKQELLSHLQSIMNGWEPNYEDFLRLHTDTVFDNTGISETSLAKTTKLLYHDAAANRNRVEENLAKGMTFFDQQFDNFLAQGWVSRFYKF